VYLFLFLEYVGALFYLSVLLATHIYVVWWFGNLSRVYWGLWGML